MAKSSFPNSARTVNDPRTRWVSATLLINLISAVLVSLILWILPVEVFQSWSIERAGSDPYKQFEAVGRAEIGCWLIRFAAPVIGVASLFLRRHSARVTAFLFEAFAGWLKVTWIDGDHGSKLHCRTIGFRGICVASGLLALGHAAQAIQDNLTNWSYYRFLPGSSVLPNISDSNRDVIRYLLEATKPGSRIFIASDQKLFFLSYYLLPRRLYYQVHPDAEFVIPQPFQQRRLEAYQLSEIDPATIDRIKPDYVLEYFEHPDLVDRSRLHDDPAWLAFFRKSHRDPVAEPNYLVCLRKTEKDDRR